MASKLQDFKHEHLQGIHRPEVNWTDMKRSVTRVPQIISKKTHLTTYRNDTEWDELYEKLLNVEKKLPTLIKETQNNNKAHKALINHSEELAKQYMAIYLPKLGNVKLFEEGVANPASASSLQTTDEIEKFELESTKRDLVEKYYQIVFDMAPAITVELQLLEDKITKSVQEILNMVKKIKKGAKTRELELLDMDKYLNAIDKLKAKQELSEKQEDNLHSLQQKFEATAERFNKINNTMKRELPFFFEMVGQVMVHLTVLIYWSFDIVSYQYYQTINLMKADFDITSDKYTFNEVLDIVNTFNSKIHKSKQQIKSLSITNFSKNYLRHLADHNEFVEPSVLLEQNSKPLANDNIDGPTKAEKTNLENPESSHWDPINYAIDSHSIAKVIFDYNAENENDISLKIGQKIKVIEKTNQDGWWKGQSEDGAVGLFPSNYVKLLS